MRNFKFILLIPMVGCASYPRVVAIEKPIRLDRIICMDATQIPGVCGNGPKDNGQKFEVINSKRMDEYGRLTEVVTVEATKACYAPGTKTIFLPFRDCPTATFFHELCHAQGLEPRKCLEKYPG